MACRKMLTRKYRYNAQLADTQAPCAFCSHMVDEETTYGKLYSIGDIHCHYFCVLLSCCLIQKGKDEEGLFGFLYSDILAEVERSKKHRCSYCNKDGATLGCSVTQCRKQFHLPCGRAKNAVSLFYGNYKTFCKDHAPKQKIPNIIMCKAKVRQAKANKMLKHKSKTYQEDDADNQEAESVCVICYERVDGFPTVDTFWPPCCARDAWFHRNCIECMALNAGIHYLKCPLCNDKDNFYKAVIEQGYYVPDRDAAWELEQNAYSELYERLSVCSVESCKCPNGRDFDAETGLWDIKLCLLCGSGGAHRGCSSTEYHLCALCAVTEPSVEQLAELQRVSVPSQNQTRPRARPVMPSRMSIRRTKGRTQYSPSTYQSSDNDIYNDSAKTLAESRQELNLSTPKRQTQNTDNKSRTQNINVLSPMKLIEREIYEKCTSGGIVLDFDKVLVEVKDKFQKPRPLVEKKKIVNNILQELINKIIENKSKEPIKEWSSPRKSSKENIEENQQDISRLEVTPEPINTELTEIKEEPLECSTSDEAVETPKPREVNIQNDSMEISENDEIINIDVVNVKTEGSPVTEKSKCVKFSPFSEKVLDNNMDIESFKNQYLNEVDRQFNSKFKRTVTFDNTNVPPKRKLPSNSVASKKRKATKMVKKFKNTEVSIRNRNINLKIKWKNDELNLKITDLKNKKRKIKKEAKQYILSPKLDITKPEQDVVMMKKRSGKLLKTPDKLKQTSISSFFKVKQPESPSSSNSI